VHFSQKFTTAKLALLLHLLVEAFRVKNEMENTMEDIYVRIEHPKAGKTAIMISALVFGIGFILCLIIGAAGPDVFTEHRGTEHTVNFSDTGIWKAQVFSMMPEHRLMWLTMTMERPGSGIATNFDLSFHQEMTIQVIGEHDDGSTKILNKHSNHTRTVTCQSEESYCDPILLYYQSYIQYSSYHFEVRGLQRILDLDFPDLSADLIFPIMRETLTTEMQLYYMNVNYTRFEMTWSYFFLAITLLVIFFPCYGFFWSLCKVTEADEQEGVPAATLASLMKVAVALRYGEQTAQAIAQQHQGNPEQAVVVLSSMVKGGFPDDARVKEKVQSMMDSRTEAEAQSLYRDLMKMILEKAKCEGGGSDGMFSSATPSSARQESARPVAQRLVLKSPQDLSVLSNAGRVRGVQGWRVTPAPAPLAPPPPVAAPQPAATPQLPRSQWPIQQKWLIVLLIGLFFFDNPFLAAEVKYASPGLGNFYIITLSTFLGLLLLFWLVIIDNIRYDSYGNPHGDMSDSHRRQACWFIPKAFLCLAISIVIISTYITMKNIETDDPAYNGITEVNSKNKPYIIATSIFMAAYILWISYLVVSCYHHLKDMLPAYLFLFSLTMFTIFITIIGIFVAAFYPIRSSGIEFLTFFGVYNLYIWVLAIAYTPMGRQGNYDRDDHREGVEFSDNYSI